MKVTLNGEAREVPSGLTVAELLTHLGLAAERIAVEHNLEILPRSLWSATPVHSEDRFEIVHFVGGG